jgi:phage tail sheath protein FI
MPNFFHGVEVVEVDSAFRDLQTTSSSVIGLIGVAPDAEDNPITGFSLNTPVLLVGDKSEALQKLGTEGTLSQAIQAIEAQQQSTIVVVRVEEGENDAATIQNLIGGVDAETGTYTGVQAFCGAESSVHVTPKLLIAPGSTLNVFFKGPNGELADPLLTALTAVAEKLRAIVIADGPNTNDNAAIAAAVANATPRVYLVDPFVLDLAGQPVPASPYVAGLISKVDTEKGFWWSPSNHVIQGILGTSRSIDFYLGDSTCRAQFLNEHNVATIIRHDGYRLFGNRTTTMDPKWQFLSVRRTADNLHDALIRAHFWAVDRNISKTYFDDVAESMNASIAKLQTQGALLGGHCRPSPELNSPANLANGQVYFDLEFTPPYPTERITFRSLLVHNALQEVI